MNLRTSPPKGIGDGSFVPIAIWRKWDQVTLSE